MRFCNNCGEQLQDNYKICPNCGLFIDNSMPNNQFQQQGFQSIPPVQNIQQQGFQPVNMNMYNQYQYGYVQKKNKGTDIVATILTVFVLFLDLGYISILANGLGSSIGEYTDPESIKEIGAFGNAFAFVFIPLLLNTISIILTSKGLKKEKTGLRIFNIIAGIFSLVLLLAFSIAVYNYFS